ncbi:MAG: C4-dicarboxylate TRAP transporter substrate-binding protein [Minwuia sp.]|nr:C4-dicarboxylate TRAP transporter substrate-binding protein [Minwuia sp.]
MTLKITSALVAGCMGLAAAMASAPAQADELRIAIGNTGSGGLVRGMYEFAEQIEKRTEGRYTGKVFELSLLNFAESMTGVRDGIADVAYVVPAYHRGEFPYGNLLVDMATAGVNPVAIAGAANEYLATCDKCLNEYKAQNQVFLGTSVIGPYYMMSVDKISTPDDFKGKKIRGFGPFGRWVEAMGATAVVLGANDIYESISQGQLDGNTHTLDVLRSLSIGEVTDYLLDAPIGVYIGNNMFNLNRDVWNDLSAADKKSFILAGGSSVAWTTVTYLAENQELFRNPSTVGVEIVEPSAAVAEATAKFRANDLKAVAKLNKEKFGIQDAEEQLQIINGLVEKWAKLTADIDVSDTKAVSDLFVQEIFAKIDPAKL